MKRFAGVWVQGSGGRGQSGIHQSSFINRHSAEKGDSPRLPERPGGCCAQMGTVPFFRHGFTLVELLVVITIIGMLVGLMLPALLAARGRARIATCTNNQHELSLAIQQYDNAKKRLPGYLNQVSQRAVSWIPVLLPYLGRNDLWEGTNGWRSNPTNAAANPVRVNLLACPDGEATDTCSLSYIINVGAAQLNSSDYNPANDTGVFRNLVPTVWASGTTAPRPISLSNIPSPAQRPMLTERQYPFPIGTTTADRVWNRIASPIPPNYQDTTLQGPTVKLTAEQMGFPWTPMVGPGPLLNTLLPPIHSGVVIVTFCDGHTESLAEDTDCSVYDSTPIP